MIDCTHDHLSFMAAFSAENPRATAGPRLLFESISKLE
jgi:hypothetical protein